MNDAVTGSKLKLELCYSAPAMLRLMPTSWGKESPQQQALLTAGVSDVLVSLREKISIITGNDIELSLLFNAFTEERIGHFIRDNKRFGFDHIYADSGGLQMVTTNQEVTPKLKAQIYETQKIADYGFCFDEIPLGLKEGVDSETGKHRSQTSSKLFKQHEFDECIASTAKNIRAQTEAFMGSNTRAFYIMQGNTAEEMERWFAGSEKELTDAHYERLQGLAPADTCIGNGELETVEMLAACHRVRNTYGEQRTGNHIHFLGVGSPSRLLPAILLRQGGYLDEKVHVSFDSSTQSMSLIMGNLMSPDGQRIKRRPVETMNLFMWFYDDMHDVIAKTCGAVSREDFYEHCRHYYSSIADLINNAPPHMDLFMRCVVTGIPLWQSLGFFRQAMDAIKDPTKQMTGLGFLRQVRTEGDMQHWRRQFSKYLKSSRISRVVENTLDFD